MNDAIFPASKMGFGCMRLPLLDENDVKSIDIPQFEQMVDTFMEAGNTYFDTAFVYHEGESEVALGKALVARYPRESFTIATKCLAWAMPNEHAAKECLDILAQASWHRLRGLLPASQRGRQAHGKVR